jgi:hypothetical protein
MGSEDLYREIASAAGEAGLRVRGGFHPRPQDDVPPLAGGDRAATVVLLGNVGGSMWPVFAASPQAHAGGGHPLDAWSREVVDRLAARFDASPLFPFDGPPWLPFQRWAMLAEPVWSSPIGPLVHAEYGLWHAYRGALAFSLVFEVPSRAEAARPCDTCSERACLRTCPVDALRDGVYDVPSCIDHLGSVAGAACLDTGCLARRICPVGRRYAYAPEQQAFHMRAFLAARRRQA